MATVHWLSMYCSHIKHDNFDVVLIKNQRLVQTDKLRHFTTKGNIKKRFDNVKNFSNITCL